MLAIVAVPAVAVALALRQQAEYQASADVLLRYQSLPSTLAGISDPNSYSYSVDPIRSTDTQLQIAELPLLANRVAVAARKQGVSTAGSSTGVGSLADTDFLRFATTSTDPRAAAVIATEYARQFTRYHQQLDSASIQQAVNRLQERVQELRANGTARGRREATGLQAKADQLETLLTLQTSNAVLVRQAATARKIRPTPKKYAFLGLGLGIVLGIGLAFLREAFDTRLRSAAHVGAVLKLPVLASIPPPPKKADRDRRLVMLAEPKGAGAESFRRLRMNIEFASIGKPSQVTMVTSALPREGKSTTLANLGVAMALAGKNVALVDLDLHRPTLADFFRIDPEHPGLSSVVLGEARLDEALAPIPLDAFSRTGSTAAAAGGDVRALTTGSLVVLPTGLLPPDPGEFVGLDGVGRSIAALRERVDVILLDAPPLLAVGDGLTIAGFADAIVVVVRSDLARRSVTGELGAILARLPAVKLGFVVCGEAGLDPRPYYGYGGYGGYSYGGSYRQKQPSEEPIR